MLISLAYIFLLGVLLAGIFVRMGLPSLLGMLITGVILGPYCLNQLDPTLTAISGDLRTLALIIILIRVGMALKVNDLREIGRPAILLCFVPATFEIIGTILLAPLLFDISLHEAALLGSVLGAVSPAVVVPRMLNLIEQGKGSKHKVPQMIMAGVSVDDIYVIILFTCLMGTMGTVNGVIPTFKFDWMQVAQIPIGIIVGFALGFGVSWFFKQIHTRDSVKVLVLLSISFLIRPVLGLLPIICMGMGMLAHHGDIAKRLSDKFNRLWVAAEILLFVLVGAVINPAYVVEAGSSIVILIFGVLIIRILGVWCCLIGTILTLRERFFCMIAYLPKATVQAAIGAVPLSMGLPCGELILTVAVVSIILTAPLGALGIDHLQRTLLKD